MSTTIIKNADWVIRWNEAEQAHRYLRNADVVFQGNVIIFVGKDYNGAADTIIPGEGICVMPGLVNIHSHPSGEVMDKGFDAEGVGGLLGEFNWVNQMVARSPDQEDRVICAEYSLCEQLLSGVTTVVDISYPYPGWFELAERSGLRLYFAPMFTSTDDSWIMSSAYQIEYKWLADEGQARLKNALLLVDRAMNHPSDRLGGMLMPAQVDTCTPGLLQSSLEAAHERAIPLQVHAGQLISEFQEIFRRHGVSPIKWLNQLGMLSPETIVSHAIMLDHYRTTNFLGTSDDLEILANSGASIAHSPMIFARIGDYLDNFGDYKKAGVNIGIGTDTYPQNMLEEMRLALLVARVVSGKEDNVSTADIFSAATIGGSNALQRKDIGRLAVGAKADLVLLDLNLPAMQPVRDPLRSLIHCALERAVRDVYVDGVKVVDQRQVVTLDFPGTSKKIGEVLQRIEASTPQRDYAGRTSEEIIPLVFPVEVG